MRAKTPLLVGAVLLAAVAGLVYFVMGTTKDVYDDDSTYPLTADFSDASGIRWKTRVQINGIDVGKIAGVAHVRSKDGRLLARVTLRIAKQYEVYQNAELRKASESLLGDFRLDLDPGTPSAARLKAGDSIAAVHSLSDVDEIKGQLLQVSKNVNRISESFSQVLSGPEGAGSLKAILSKVESTVAAVEQTSMALRHTIVGNDKVLSHIIENIGKFTEALAQVSEPGGDMRTVAHNLAKLSGKLDLMADSLGGLLGSAPTAGNEAAPGGAQQGGQSLKGALDNLNDSLGHLSSVTKKIDEGAGHLGTGDQRPWHWPTRSESTLDSAGELIGSIASIETLVELRTEYDVPMHGANLQIQPSIKNTLGLRILPKPDKFYILEAVSDPRGRQTRTLTTAQVDNTTVTTDQTLIAFNELKFSAQFAKRYYFATLRFGITENTGGLGLDLHGFNEAAEIRLDAYDFDRRDPQNIRPIFPRLKVTGILELVPHIHLQLGIDDPFNNNLQVWFLGGLLRFTDEDLKAMLTIAPKP